MTTRYGRSLEFGFTLSGSLRQPALDLARAADEVGYDLIGVMDHPYQPRNADMWTLLSMMAAVTKRIRVFPNVTCTPLRPPAMLAKAAATLDALSEGRIELGLGAGSMWDGIQAYGGPRRSPGEARRALEEAIAVIRLMWSGRGVTYAGRHYSVDAAATGPMPSRDIEIWLGVGGPRAVELVGRAADGWLPSLGPVAVEQLPDLHQRVDDAAVAAGRDPKAIRRLLNLNGLVDDVGPGSGRGSARAWVDTVAGLATEHAIDTFLFWPSRDEQRQLRVFAEEVIPAVRDQLR